METKEEREQRGHPTGYATPYKAMGGLTGFSSLAEGYLRLDPSGRGKKKQMFPCLYRNSKFAIGRPDDEFLNQPITAMDHPILRSHASHDPNSKQQKTSFANSSCFALFSTAQVLKLDPK